MDFRSSMFFMVNKAKKNETKEVVSSKGKVRFPELEAEANMIGNLIRSGNRDLIASMIVDTGAGEDERWFSMIEV